MTRRWSLITTIAVLAVALAFVVAQLVRGQESGEQQASPSAGAESPRGVAWWPLHRSGTAKAGEHDAVVSGDVEWTDGPEGGALRLDRTSEYVKAGSGIDTAGADYSVAARVRLTSVNGFRTAVSQDGKRISAFFLQYSGQDENFAFSSPGARTVAEKTERPQANRWYHLTGTYSQKGHRMRIYVDGRLAGSREASSKAKPTGDVLIGRGRVGGKAVDHWNGDIADVHVYDRELAPGEVDSLSAREPG
ncbi:LamG domain-containing protein [Streptomyces flaveus]|uniref:LamG-like jellyroll fold domain-containing protein n=1 Tax=Streptomyces flaveus TaxID=66370 RepID=A0A917RA55_9ACTN|nr:LamG domain-containing protein [Streptomyces flaveus]GGK98250.1 hypothetical protein GCM10010094_68930 [Streptomyces flaveus]